MPKVPLASFWENLGATLKKEKEWEIPSLFKDFASECETVRKRVGLLDLSPRGKVEVRGKDRIDFLHRVLSNDIRSLGIGTGCYAALLDAKAQILADMSVYVSANAVLLEMESGLEKKVIEKLSGLRATEEATFRDVTSEWTLLSLQGPRAEALVGALIYGPMMMVTEEFRHANFSLLDTTVILARRSVTGEKGFHLFIPAQKAAPIAKRILAVGGLYGLRPVGSNAHEILRIEAGIPRYGIDMDETTTLSETGLESIAAGETKGCCPGQEVVAGVKTYGGLNRKLCGLVFDKEGLPKTGDKVLKDNVETGFITSACHSPTLGKGIALAYLQKGSFDPGTQVSIQSTGLAAKVTPLPLVKRDFGKCV